MENHTTPNDENISESKNLKRPFEELDSSLRSSFAFGSDTFEVTDTTPSPNHIVNPFQNFPIFGTPTNDPYFTFQPVQYDFADQQRTQRRKPDDYSRNANIKIDTLVLPHRKRLRYLMLFIETWYFDKIPVSFFFNPFNPNSLVLKNFVSGSLVS